MIRIAMVLTPMSDHHLCLASQIGVTDIVARYPGTDLEALLSLKRRVASFGMDLSIVEGYLPHDLIVHGKAGRDRQIADFVQLLQNMGKAEVPICCYHWMPNIDWTRTSVDERERGGALVTAFDADALRDSPIPESGAIDSKALWENLEYFLKRVVPVAQESGVSLAMHPDDPPIPLLRGQSQIMCTVEAFERLLKMDSAPANGICFCQGTFAEMGVDIPSTIRRLAEGIRYVHFRDVVGTVPKFRESFHDNGKTDMFEAMRTYHEIGFDGPMRPDHVPTLDGEANDEPGYAMLGRLYAAGYMRGLIDAARDVSG